MTYRKPLTFAALVLAGAAAFAAPGIARDHGPEGGPGMLPSFDQIDANKDGKITPDEVTAFRTGMVAGADADKDGLLSLEELTAQEMKMLERAAAQHAARRIADQDINGDSKLSVEELLSRPVPADLFARVDTDGDGAVSQIEFEAAQARLHQGHMARFGHDRGYMEHGSDMPPTDPVQ